MTSATQEQPPNSRRRLAVGAYGERLAARHLTDLGMVVLDRNWRCDCGEIDLVLRDGDVLVVCEVKTRSSASCGSPHEAVTPAKLGRLRRLAARWVVEHAVHPADVRIDLVAVICPRRGPAEIEHVAGLA
jgi:putative endonuclease